VLAIRRRAHFTEKYDSSPAELLHFCESRCGPVGSFIDGFYFRRTARKAAHESQSSESRLSETEHCATIIPGTELIRALLVEKLQSLCSETSMQTLRRNKETNYNFTHKHKLHNYTYGYSNAEVPKLRETTALGENSRAQIDIYFLKSFVL